MTMTENIDSRLMNNQLIPIANKAMASTMNARRNNCDGDGHVAQLPFDGSK